MREKPVLKEIFLIIFTSSTTPPPPPPPPLPSPGFVLYALFAISFSLYLIFVLGPQYGQTNILIYIAICSLVGSLSVMACKGLSIAIKLTFAGVSQFSNPLAWFFLVTVVGCITIQMNYLNKALDIFNTSVVTPIYYVMFTTLTIIASAILFQEWNSLKNPLNDVVGALGGFATIIVGVFLLHAFKDYNIAFSDLLSLTARQSAHSSEDGRTSTIPLESVLMHSTKRKSLSSEVSDLISGEEGDKETEPLVNNVNK